MEPDLGGQIITDPAESNSPLLWPLEIICCQMVANRLFIYFFYIKILVNFLRFYQTSKDPDLGVLLITDPTGSGKL